MTPRLNIVGAGHVGRVLGRLFSRAGVFAMQDIVARSQDSAAQAQAFIGAGAPAEGATGEEAGHRAARKASEAGQADSRE